MSTFLNRNPYRRAHRPSFFAGFDPILTAAVGALLVIGTLLVYAATRDWYSANGLDPEYYLKRHVINIVIGIALAWGTTIIDYRLLRAYTPFIWGLGVLGLILVLIPGIGSEINGARAWIGLPFGFQIQPAEIASTSGYTITAVSLHCAGPAHKLAPVAAQYPDQSRIKHWQRPDLLCADSLVAASLHQH